MTFVIIMYVTLWRVLKPATQMTLKSSGKIQVRIEVFIRPLWR